MDNVQEFTDVDTDTMSWPSKPNEFTLEFLTRCFIVGVKDFANPKLEVMDAYSTVQSTETAIGECNQMVKFVFLDSKYSALNFELLSMSKQDESLNDLIENYTFFHYIFTDS